jgi:hypothetical protein
MAALPTDPQVREMFAALRELNVDKLTKRLRAAIDRDRKGGDTIPDGYPTGSGGAGGGAPRVKVDEDAHGPDELIDMTSVELAVLARERTPRDDHHRLVLEACNELRAMVTAFDRMLGRLAAIDGVVDGAVPDAELDPGCKSCARVKDGAGRPYFSSAARELGGRDGLCKWCYGWTRDRENNPAGKWPPAALLERRFRQGRITSKDILETRRSA